MLYTCQGCPEHVGVPDILTHVYEMHIGTYLNLQRQKRFHRTDSENYVTLMQCQDECIFRNVGDVCHNQLQGATHVVSYFYSR